MRTSPSVLTALALSACLLSSGCSSDDGGGKAAAPTPTITPTSTHTPQPTNTPITPTNTPASTPTPTTGNQLDISVCAADAGPFSVTIDHPFLPLPVGAKWILVGEEDGEAIRVEITSLDDTEVVAGVITRVIEEREWEGGELVEVSRNFFVRAPDGSVCYYGEDVDDYEDGEIVGHGGAWRAGVNGNLPGILMPANPAVGQIFRQEVAIGVAEDTDTIRFLESSPLDSGTSDKVWARNVGLIVDDVVERVAVVEVPLEEARMIIESNSTDGDTGSQIVAYQVIVEREDPLRVFTVHVPAAVNSVTVTPQFLEAGTEYAFEVLAIEQNGNQTISESSFETTE